MSPSRITLGFTLLETLVALALLAILTVFLSQGLRATSRQFRDWTMTVPDELADATVHDVLRDLLDNAYPAVMGGNGPRFVTFDGAADSLTLTTLMPPGVLPGGHYRVRIALQEGNLTLRWAPERNERTPFPASSAGSRTILDHVQAVRFAYFGNNRRGERARWVGAWTQQVRLPQLVRLDVTFAPPITRTWPPLTARTHVEDDISCVFEPAIQDCLGR